MEKENTKMFYTIFNMKLAGFLMQKGFVLMDIAQNRDDTSKKVFHFRESNALHRAISEWKENNTRNKRK